MLDTPFDRVSTPAILCLPVVLVFALPPSDARALGNASILFDIYVPANQKNNGAKAHLVVTATAPGPTLVTVLDDALDGDDDDSATVTLQQGESLVIRPADGDVDDDAGGTWDGDLFQVTADKPVIALVSTGGGYQHDWIPAADGRSAGTEFWFWVPPGGATAMDIDVFAYEPTRVHLQNVTTAPTFAGGVDIDVQSARTVIRSSLGAGEDLRVSRGGIGVDVLKPGHTYRLRSTEPVTVQIGHVAALCGASQARDGAGFVPGRNGAFDTVRYFTVPHQVGREDEKEMHLYAFDDTSFALEGWDTELGFQPVLDGTMTAHDTLDLTMSWGDALESAFTDYSLYRLTVSDGARMALFEGNWLEKGNYHTADVATMAVASDGSSAGLELVAWMPKPGNQTHLAPDFDVHSHLYVHASEPDTVVMVVDAATMGQRFHREVLAGPDAPADVRMSISEWKDLYEPGERTPWVVVLAEAPVSAFVSNHNDNWLTWMAAPAATNRPKVGLSAGEKTLACKDGLWIDWQIENPGMDSLDGLVAEMVLPIGVRFDPSQVLDAVQGAALSVLPDGRERLTWTVDSLEADTGIQGTQVIWRECVEDIVCRCGPATVSLQVTGADGAAMVAHHAQLGLDLMPAGLASVDRLTARQAIEGHVRVRAVMAEVDAETTFRLSRAMDPLGPYTLVDQFDVTPTDLDGEAPVVERTDYAVSPGERWFYRLDAVGGDCGVAYGPATVVLAAESSSGGNGGLESNGHLADALARRSIARAHGVSTPAARIGGFARRTAAVRAMAPALESLIPAVGPRGLEVISVTPHDLAQVTNAEAVVAYDVVDGDRRVASAMIMETAGTLYDHTKAICDRAHGGRVLNLTDVPLTLPDGTVVSVVQMQVTGKGTFESAVSLKLYPSKRGDLVRVESRFRQSEYSAPNADQPVLNVQLWSATPGFELAMAEDLLARLADQGEVVFDAGGHAPAVWFESASLTGRELRWKVAGRDAPGAGVLRFAPDDGGPAEEIDLVVDELGDYVFELPQDAVDASLFLFDRRGQPQDVVWLSDGAWTVLDSAVFGGGPTGVDQYGLTCGRPTSADVVHERRRWDADDDAWMALSGCASVQGVSQEMLGVARHLAGPNSPLDLSAHSSIHWWQRSEQPTTVCLEKASRVGAAQPCFTVPPKPEGGYVWVPLAAFRIDGDDAPALLDDVELLTFTYRGDGPVDLQVARVGFGRMLPLAVSPDVSEVFEAPYVIQCSVESPLGEMPWGLVLAFGFAVYMVRRRMREEVT